MKKLLIAAICAAGLVSSNAQGFLNFLNLGAGNAILVELPGEAARPATTDDNVTVELWAGANADSLAMVASTGIAGAGIVNGGEIEIADASLIRVRGFSDNLAGTGLFGEGIVDIENHPLKAPGGLLPVNLQMGQDLVVAVPEPGTIALGALGAALLFFRRRK